MCYATAIMFPADFRSANCVVPISDFVTFLNNTQPYRRDLRRAEYGDERDPKQLEQFKKIAPMRRIKEIQVPLYVVAGENDPRVPASEARQVYDALKDRGSPVWLSVAQNEGHIWGKKEIIPYIDRTPGLIRPANYPPDQPGRGYTIVETASGAKVGVIHLQGRVFMNTHCDCPFVTAKKIIAELRTKTNVIAVDMHCEATSEKVAMGWWLDGHASFVFGTHTHIQTADERVLPQGTAYITDCGMTGPYDGVRSDDLGYSDGDHVAEEEREAADVISNEGEDSLEGGTDDDQDK
jgi:metallophosphoesterase (TIGR00282 family)